MINSTKAHRRLLSRLGALSLLTIALIFGTSAAPASAALPMWGWGSHSVADYVALGDSFTAGQGAPPYLNSSGTCLQSKYASYPVITAALSKHKLAANESCSGADTAHVVAQLGKLTLSSSELNAIRLVTLTVGGIDAGSNQILGYCATPGITTDMCSAFITSLGSQLPTVGAKLVLTYQAVAAKMPHAKIVVLNYPHLFNTGVSDVGNAVNLATDALNVTIANAASSVPNVQVVNVAPEFNNHGIGSSIPYISFDPYNLLWSANFHPNLLGNSVGYFGALLKAGVLW